MTLSGLKYFEYNLPFVEPLETASGSIVERSGLIVILTDDEGNNAYGDIAPLEMPGMTVISDCINQIEQVKNVLGKKNDIELLIRNENFAPEVKFGIEQALHSLKLIKNGNNDSSPHSNTIAINALIGIGDEDEIFKKAAGLIEEGYKTIKIKINNVDLGNKIDMLNRLYAGFGNTFRVRLDANGSLSFDEAEEFLSFLNPFMIEYIEDPVNDIDNLIALQEKSAVRIALDEPVTSKNMDDLLDIPSIKYYVIKPVKIGFYRTIDIINAAESKNKSIVISSVFESAVGRSALLYLASLIRGAHAHGLDTGKYLVKDLEDSVYTCDKPAVEFELSNYPPVFNFEGMLQ